MARPFSPTEKLSRERVNICKGTKRWDDCSATGRRAIIHPIHELQSFIRHPAVAQYHIFGRAAPRRADMNAIILATDQYVGGLFRVMAYCPALHCMISWVYSIPIGTANSTAFASLI